eukprot:gb/GECG01004599.1/.p1 GENE.gb/GECG01004599.1/~~gb/GECG01004599.1/.p1  ORF type:complete len:755 (+),score=59.89 gb/GECG01004599.1/:1-2265(+)
MNNALEIQNETTEKAPAPQVKSGCLSRTKGWEKRDEFNHRGNFCRRLAKLDVFQEHPEEKPATKTGLVGTALLALILGGYAAVLTYDYYEKTHLISSLQPLSSLECRGTSIACLCGMGCLAQPYGPQTISRNREVLEVVPPGNIALLDSGSSKSLYICPGSSLTPETLVIAPNNVLSWTLNNSSTLAVAPGMDRMGDHWPSAISTLDPLPESLFMLEYITLDDRGYYFAVQLNTLNIPNFETQRTETPVAKTVGILEEIGGTFEPGASDFFRLQDDIIVMKMHAGCELYAMNSTEVNEDKDVDQFLLISSDPTDRCIITLDYGQNAVVEISPNQTVHRFNSLTGWVSESYRLQTHCPGGYFNRTGVLNSIHFRICVPRQQHSNSKPTTGKLQVEVPGGPVSTKDIQLKTGTFQNGSSEFISVRWASETKEKALIFYPFSDFEGQLSGEFRCYVFVVAGIGSPAGINIVEQTIVPHCTGGLYQGKLYPYEIASDLVLFGNVIIQRSSGKLVALNGDQTNELQDTVCRTNGSNNLLQCAPFLPVRFPFQGTISNGKITLARLQSQNSQLTYASSPLVFYVVYELQFSDLNAEPKLPCFGDTILRLPDFDSGDLRANESFARSGFIEEFHYLNGSTNIRYTSVSYTGPTSDTMNTDFIPRTVGGILHYLNVYPSLKMKYQEARTISVWSIPGSVGGILQPVFTMLSLALPFLYLLLSGNLKCWNITPKRRGKSEANPSSSSREFYMPEQVQEKDTNL